MCFTEETDDSVEDWRDLMSPRGLISGFGSDPYFSKTVSDVFSDHVFVSNHEGDLREDEYALVNNRDMMMEKYGFSDSGSRLPCLSIQSSMSPNELPDSPLMLPNSQLSPTTGTMNSSPPENDNSMFKSTSISADMEPDGDDVSSYQLKPPWPGYLPSQNHNFQTEEDCKSLHPVQLLADHEFPITLESHRLKSSGLESAADTKTPFSTALMDKTVPFQLSSHSYGVADTGMKESYKIAQVKGEQSMDVVHNGLYSSVGTAKISEDGFNWRKYGQKQVKGSDYPRSYYKCTHLTCLVKKKVERSHDGDITEIIYKGDHNHPKPIPTRRSTFSSYGEPTDIGEGLDIQSSTPNVTEPSDPHSNNQKLVGKLESPETLEQCSSLASHDEEQDTTTKGSLSDDDIETETKRRKKESSLVESALGSRSLREPRVIIQIESEIDIVDDGYRWRKYGQKVVKGNPNPRSYYKCTSAGCTVRKHVERASHDMKFVLTTYEGKHNHLVPAARNSNHINSSNGNLAPSSSTSQPILTLPRNSHLPKAEPQDFIPPFNRKIEYESEFLRPEYFGNFSGGSSSMYHQMRFPTLPSSGIYGGFGLNTSYTSSAPPMIPSVGNLSIPLPLNLQLPSSLAMGNYNLHGRTLNPVPPFFMGQQMKDSDFKPLRPKEEQQD